MGRFLNPDNTAFQTALNSEIYIDKTELLTYTNKVIGTKQIGSRNVILMAGDWM